MLTKNAFKEGERFTFEGLKYKVLITDPLKVSVVGYEGVITHLTVPPNIEFRGESLFVATIGEKAFYNAKNLTYVDLGSVNHVGMKAFANCSALTTLVVPKTVATIATYAFYGCGITSLDIPGNDVVLEDSAFSACKKMTSITFSGHGAVIGSNAFYKNNGVTSVDLSTVAYLGIKAFPYCYGLTSLTIPGNIEVVKEYAFYRCVNLKDLTVESGVKKIGASAFSGCTSLENVTLPKSLTYMGGNVFYGLTFLDLDGEPMDVVVKDVRGHFFTGSDRVLRMTADLVVGEEFSVDGVLYKITSAASREASAIGFEDGASALPSSVICKGWEVSVTSVGEKAFYACETLTSADLANVKTIALKAFALCPSLAEVSFGDDLQSVGSYAFYGLTFYDGATKLPATAASLRGHSFEGNGSNLYLVS